MIFFMFLSSSQMSICFDDEQIIAPKIKGVNDFLDIFYIKNRYKDIFNWNYNNLGIEYLLIF